MVNLSKKEARKFFLVNLAIVSKVTLLAVINHENALLP